MRFGDALCAAMHEDKWITQVIEDCAPDGERFAFKFEQKTGRWRSAFSGGAGLPWLRHSVPLKTIPCRMGNAAILADWEIVKVEQ